MMQGAHGSIAALVLAVACSSPPNTRVVPDLWEVTVLGDASDPRFLAVREATQFWNQQLDSLGIALRFGQVTPSAERIPEATLQRLSDAVVRRRVPPRPRELDRIPGEVVVAFATSDLRSVGIAPEHMGRALVVLRPANIAPLSFPNVARNVAAHELGHVLGLNHNTVPGTLMCAPPGTCTPASWRSDTARFFPLTNAERAELSERWIGRPRS